MIWVNNVWVVVGGADAKFTGSVARLASELFLWYGAESRAGRHLTRVQSLEPSMLGSAGKPRCKLHGAETNGVLEFCVSLIHRHSARLPQHDLWQRAANGLVKLKNLIKAHTGRWAAALIQDL